MKLQPHAAFSGQCETAFKFYEQCLGGKITFMMKYAESPMAEQVPPDWRGKIIHASMQLGDSVLMGVDAPPGRFEKSRGITLSLSVEDAAEAERIFHGLAEKGEISMPLAETFWAIRFGMLVDQFGIPWMVNCENKA
ncbi:MAG TPA: VOC family protein [Candidatus Acidoferrum sp.]|nr:VOC family protein [Candidatus Acidoferrum sp.]